MHIRRFTIISILFMILVGWFTYVFVSNQSVSLDLFNTHLGTYPIAFWVLLPLGVMVIASILHMSFYSMLMRLRWNRYKKDFERLMGAIADAMLSKANRRHDFKTDRYKLIGGIIDSAVISPAEGMSPVGNATIDQAIELVQKVEAGEVQNLKKLQLSKDNPLLVRNEINSIDQGQLKASDVLDKADRYNTSVCEHAFRAMIPTSPLYVLEKHLAFMDKTSFFEIMNGINSDKNKLDVTNESVIKIIEAASLNEAELIEVSQTLSHGMLPDQRLKIFELLSENSETAMGAYLYTLLDLEMITLADEILDASQEDEFLRFKAYRELKELHKPYKLDLFI